MSDIKIFHNYKLSFFHIPVKLEYYGNVKKISISQLSRFLVKNKQYNLFGVRWNTPPRWNTSQLTKFPDSWWNTCCGTPVSLDDFLFTHRLAMIQYERFLFTSILNGWRCSRKYHLAIVCLSSFPPRSHKQ